MGVRYVTKIVANHMKNHGIHGSIINITSINGDAFPYKEATAYANSKAAAIHMAKSLVTELSNYKIRINSIAPGLFHTPVRDHLGTDHQDKNLLGRSLWGLLQLHKIWMALCCCSHQMHIRLI